MLRRTLGRFFWTTYDHIGRLVAVNVCVAAILFAPLTFWTGNPWVFGACLAWIALGHAVFQTAMAAFALEMRRFQDPGWSVFWGKTRALWRRGLAGHLALFAIVGGLVVNIRFWLDPPLRPDLLKWPGLAIAGICAWTLAFLAMAYLYFLPALAEEGAGVLRAAKRAALLTLDNVLVSLGAAVFLIVIEAAMLRSMAGFVLFGWAFIATMGASLYTTVLYKYERLEKEQKAAESQGATPTSWREVLDQGGKLPGADPGNPDVDEDGEPRRSLRELWRPWEY